MNKQHNIYFIAIVFILVIASCKKEVTQGENCNCPSTGQTETLIKMSDVTGNGFFVFYKFNTIQNNSIVFDSCNTKVTQFGNFGAYPGNFSGSVPSIDSVKINGVKFQHDVFYYFKDSTKQCFSSPRHCELFGDSITNPFFVVINHMDYTSEPIYTNWGFIPDSIKRGRDSIINIGSRSNILNTQVRLLPSTLNYLIYNKELKNSETTVTLPSNFIYFAPVDYYYLTINTRNWTKVRWKKQSFYFATDNQYIKKIKLYN